MKSAEQSLTFKIRGMDCAEEVAVLKREVGSVVGGEDRLAFDILNGRMAVLPRTSRSCRARAPSAPSTVSGIGWGRTAIWRKGGKKPGKSTGYLKRCQEPVARWSSSVTSGTSAASSPSPTPSGQQAR